MSDNTLAEFSAQSNGRFVKLQDLRYGENPHQSAASYIEIGNEVGIANSHQLHGKPMSYNNFIDADAARRAAFDFLGTLRRNY